MQEFFVLFVQLFGGLNFKEKRKCKQLARESYVCTRLVAFLGTCCAPSHFAAIVQGGGVWAEWWQNEGTCSVAVRKRNQHRAVGTQNGQLHGRQSHRMAALFLVTLPQCPLMIVTLSINFILLTTSNFPVLNIIFPVTVVFKLIFNFLTKFMYVCVCYVCMYVFVWCMCVYV